MYHIQMYQYRAKVERVVDGDTVDLLVDLGFHVQLKIRGRLEGVDTPERGHPEYKSATEECKQLLEFVKDDEGFVYITTSKTGKYGRWIVRIVGVTDVLAKKYPYGNK